MFTFLAMLFQSGFGSSFDEEIVHKTRISLVWSSFRESPCLVESYPYWEGVKSFASHAAGKLSKREGLPEGVVDISLGAAVSVTATPDTTAVSVRWLGFGKLFSSESQYERVGVVHDPSVFASSVESTKRHNAIVREILEAGDRGDFALLFESSVENNDAEKQIASMQISFQPFKKKTDEVFDGKLYVDTVGVGRDEMDSLRIRLRKVDGVCAVPYISFEYTGDPLNYERIIDYILSLDYPMYRYSGIRQTGEWNGVTVSLDILRNIGLGFLLPNLSEEELSLQPFTFVHRFLDPVEEFYKKILIPEEKDVDQKGLLRGRRFLVVVGAGVDKNPETNRKISFLRDKKRELWSFLRGTLPSIGRLDHHLLCVNE